MAGKAILWIAAFVVVAGANFTSRLANDAQSPAPLNSQPAAASSLYVENLPGIRTGAVSDAQRMRNSAAINARLARGAELHLHGGTRIEIGESLHVGSGGAIIGDLGASLPVIFMPASTFINTDDSAKGHRYGPASVGIDLSGQVAPPFNTSRGVRIENLRLVSEAGTGRRLRGIVGRNVADCMIRNVELSGFPTAIGIALASARRCSVTKIRIHDFSDDRPSQILPQSTGIEIDNDIVNGVPTSDTMISDFTIERLRMSGPLLARWNYQTDGINVMNSASQVDISNGRISGVGEGIDTFGSFGTISNVAISDAYIFGLKFIHGASHNRVRDVTIANAGLAAVNFSGSDQASQDTAGNILTHVTISNIDPLGTWREHSTAGILISGRKARRSPIDNQVLASTVNLGPNGKYGWLDQSTGHGNRGSDLKIVGGRSLDRKILILYGGGSATLTH